MDNLITVVSLQGQAWAVALDGSRRELQVGDTISANEMVVTAEGAQIDLQFANNQILSLIGEQEASAQALQAAQALPLSAPLTAINTPQTTSVPASLSENVAKEGHNFVQLVRIAEIIEADGFTPLTVARIQEIIKPLGMVLPERDFEDDRWKDNYSRNEHQSVDLTPPELQGGQLEALQNFDADIIRLDLGVRFKDAVSGSNITYTAENLPKGLIIDPKTGVVSGKIDSSASQGGNTGTKGDYKVTITVTDPAGNSSEHEFVWTVTNPPPVATDDRQTIDEDTVATGNVIKGTNSSNSGGGADNDPDGDELVVTGFTVAGDPTVYPAGSTVTIAGVGELTLNANGDYTFTPDKDWNGTVPEVSYSISDGEGGTADAKLNITVDPVNDAPVAVGSINDQANADASNPTVTLDLKELFKDVDNTTDELTYSIKGLPAGLTFDPVTGVISGTIDKSASQGGPNDDGIYKVTVTAKDLDGLTAEQTFTWTVTNPPPAAANDEGDTFKTVELNINAANGVLRNDTDPDGDDLSVVGVVAGSPTDQPNTGVNSAIKGAFGTLVLQPDGSYIYTPDLSNDTVWQLPAGDKLTDTFTYTVSDGEGGFATAELVITINGQSNTPPFSTPNDENGPSVDGEITVYEKGLTAGSDPGKGHVADGIINVSAMDGLKSLTIGGTELTLTDLANLTSGTPVSISVAGGTLTLTGFEPLVATKLGVDKTIGGKLNYSYELTADQVHANGNGNNSLTLDIQLAVKDDQDAVSVPADNKLVVNVIDDVPHIDTTTHEPMLEVDETTLGSAATEDFAGIFTPSYGADGKGVADKYTLIVNAGADSGLVDTATGTAIKLYIAADGSIEGRVGAEDGDVAFKLSVNANGKVTLTQNSAVKHPNSKDPDDKVSLKDSGIKLELKITDTDGDTATESADIGKFIGFKDDGPTLNTAQVDGDGFVIGNVIVDEKYLPTGSASDAARLTVIKELPINFGADGAVNAANETGLIFANTDALEALKLKSGTTELTYQISGDGHTITATAGGKNIFTITLSVDVNGKASYEFTLKGPLDHTLENDIAANIKLPFDITATDGDGDSVDLKFKVEVVDDTPKNEVRELTVDEDGAVSFSNADINNSTTKITSDVKHGTVTIGNDGKITYTPNEDYRGSDSYTYTVTTASGTYERTVNITVKPVADAPLFADRTDGGVVVTPEDTEKSLGLKLPAIKDIGATGQNDPGYSGTDYSELLGAITLTPSGAGYIAGDTKFTTKVNGAGAEIELKPVGGKITIVITDTSGGATPSDGYHVKGDIVPTKDESNGVYYLTKEEYEAITAHPAADRHENFKVEVSVDSYEVDADGKKLTDVNGANSKQTITVDVQAVTDEVVLNVKEDTTQNGVTVVISDANKTADITFDEDTSFNLTNILAPAAFKDLDGSETRYLGLKGLPNGTTVTVDGVDYVIGQAGTPTVDFGGATGVVPAITIAGTATGLPNITITPPKDFSGDLTGIKVILGALDSDSDSSTANPSPVTDEITINLHVKPVAGDLDIKGATGNEDTAITFLTGVKVTDASTATGTLGEVITKVSFKLPAEWTPADSGKTWTNTAGQVWTLTAPTGTYAPAADKYTVSFEAGEYVITFDANSTLTREEREEILGKFTLTPPAHSSKDVTLEIKVTSKDFSVISGGDPSAEVEVSGSLKVTVKPVAERADSSTNDGSTVSDNFDVKLNPSYVYTNKGEEDEEFNLGVDGSFKLSAGWSNEDGKWVRTGENWTEDTSGGRSEDTFALLTPYTTVDNSAQANATVKDILEGSVFTYIGEGGKKFTLPFAGEPVKIPMQYLDSVQFKGPEDWSGVVKIKVQAGTIDYDEDDNAATKLEISGESWLTNLIIEPRADQVTLKVDTPIKTLEDTPVKLNIVPTSSDKNETFDVTISDIPKGAKITYDGVDYDTLAGSLPAGLTNNGDGTFTLEIEGFDKTKQPTLTPPKDSNELINLTVKAESVDTLTYIDKNGVSQTITHKDPSKAQELPINVEVQGVPDEPNVTIVGGKEYWEDGAEDSSAQGAATGLKVALKDLVTSMESGEIKNTDDGSGGLTVDGSETVTLSISDLPEGFTLTGAGPQLGAGSGTERVWVISKADLDKVQIVVPEHYSGTVKFTVQPVVTENDNPSEVFFEKQNVSFKVKPVAEASLSVSSNLLEDIVGQLSLTAVGADTNEYISAVRISAAEVTAKELTLHAADGTVLTPGADGFYTFTYDGLNSQKAPDVYVKGPANYSGDIKLNIGYTVTDPVADGTITAATKEGTVEHTLNFAPVTDKIDLSLGSIDGGATVGGVTTQTNPGSIKVKLNIEQKVDPNADASVNDGKDIDNSEQLMHVLITGVPAGVSVKGAVETAKGQWLITITGKQWSGNATLEHELEFVVSGYAAPFTDQTITITTYSKDTGAASYEKDSVEWKLTYERADKEQENDLPTVTLAPLPNPKESEDEPFSLNKVVAGTIGVHSGDYNVTLTIRTKEGDNTTFDGMTATQVVENGETITLWTKTEKVSAGQSGQEKLEQMLENIKVNTPKDANSSDLKGASAGADGKLKLDINLSVHTDGISRDAQAKPEVIITPVTDDIAIGVSTNTVGEGVEVALNITLPTDTVDGELGAAAGWTIVDGKVYIHVADDGTGLKGQLTDAGGTALDVYTGTAPDGTPTGGKLYAVDADQLAGLKFVPDATKPHQTGKLDITVLVKHQEQGAGNAVVSSGTGSVEIQQSNSGYEATITAAGAELQGKADDQLIKLDITGQGLKDKESDEVIDSAFISGLPDGFTVWVGEPATMASNAGGGTWAISLVGNNLPANISIKPPKNWAGTLEDLKFTVMSGHAGLTPTASDIRFDLVVNPVANGIEMNPTLSFGNAGDKIELNLNASMKDPSKATGAKDEEGKLTDQYTELTELSLSGFPDGQKVQFFIGDSEVPLDGSQATFDGSTWTITGLSQSDLQNLKFLHGEGSADITVKGRTYEVNAAGEQYKESGVPQYSDWSDAKTAAINISPTVPTSGADHFLWNDKAINGFGGEDTVQLRFGDNLGTDDFIKMKNIEIIDMSGKASGSNSITGLTPEDVFNMTDGDNLLKIIADKNDSVVLDSKWGTGATVGGKTTYSYTDPDSSVKINLEVNLID